MGARRLVLASAALAALWPSVALADSITASEAAQHVGQNATVCGQVASAHYAPTSKAKPTFLNLDKPYPNQVFTVVIFGSNRSKFGKPEVDYKDKRICVTGKIAEY